MASLGFRFGPFTLNRPERLLLRDGEPVRIGSRALDILIALEGVERLLRDKTRPPGKAPLPPETVAKVLAHGSNASAAVRRPFPLR